MKTKRTLIAVMILSMALLTACSTKESADNSATSLDDLYQQENQVFADHEDVWNKVFGMMDKTTADPNGNYADYLADTIESGKEAFTDEELKTLTDDMETIRNLEEQIAEMENENGASDTTGQENNAENVSPFKNFPARILMAILLMKVSFLTMPSLSSISGLPDASPALPSCLSLMN